MNLVYLLIIQNRLHSIMFFFTGDRSVICISYWANWKVVIGSQTSTNTGRWVFLHYLRSDTPQTFNWYGLKNMKLFEEQRLAADVSVYAEIECSNINSSKSKDRLSETAGIGFQLARIGTEGRKDGTIKQVPKYTGLKIYSKTLNYVPKMNLFLKLFSRLFWYELSNRTYINVWTHCPATKLL